MRLVNAGLKDRKSNSEKKKIKHHRHDALFFYSEQCDNGITLNALSAIEKSFVAFVVVGTDAFSTQSNRDKLNLFFIGDLLQ